MDEFEKARRDNLRKIMAEERSLGIKSTSEVDLRAKQMLARKPEKPKPRPTKKSAKTKSDKKPKSIMVAEQRMTKIQQERLAEIRKRKAAMARKRTASERDPKPPVKSVLPPSKKKVVEEKPKKKKMYHCKQCDKVHEIDYHRKLFEERTKEKFKKLAKKTSGEGYKPKRRKIIDEDDLDDFIVRDDHDKFNYDRYEYDDYDDEDDMAMEAGFDDIEREELISRKIGKREDDLEYHRMLERGEDPDK